MEDDERLWKSFFGAFIGSGVIINAVGFGSRTESGIVPP